MRVINLKDSVVIVRQPVYDVSRIYEHSRQDMSMSKKELNRYLKSLKVDQRGKQ